MMGSPPLAIRDIIDLVRYVGVPAIILIIWWWDQRRFNLLKEMIQDYKALVESHQEQQKEAIDAIRETRDAIYLNVQGMSRMETKIDNNRFCPIMRAGVFKTEGGCCEPGKSGTKGAAG